MWTNLTVYLSSSKTRILPLEYFLRAAESASDYAAESFFFREGLRAKYFALSSSS